MCNNDTDQQILNNIIDILNPYVGDAIHNCILVNIILSIYKMSMDDWFDLVIKRPSKQFTINVLDKTLYICNNDESRLIKPENIQNGLDTINNKYNCRSFIRPSGTEDLIRVYIEADKNLDIIEKDIIELFK